MAWNELSVKGRKPAAWIMRHIEKRTAKGSFINELPRKEFPAFTIISNQAGCAKPMVMGIVHTVLNKRIREMKNDVEKWFKIRNQPK